MRYIFVVVLSLLASPVLASSGPWGLGLILFGPTGLSAKYQQTPENAIDGAIAFDLNDEFYIHGDYLWYERGLAKEKNISLDLHYGVGGRIYLREEDDNGKGKNNDDDKDRLGIRFPLGLNVYFPKPSIEMFTEIALIMDIVEKTDASIHFAIGARYFF